MRAYLLNVLVAYDVLANVLAGGSPDQTISMRAALAQRQGARWGCILCRLLDWFEKNHCELSIIGDAARAEAIEKETGLDDDERTTA